jgi:hypothetical protein
MTAARIGLTRLSPQPVTRGSNLACIRFLRNGQEHSTAARLLKHDKSFSSEATMR